MPRLSAQLGAAAEREQRRHRDHRARLDRQARASPDTAEQLVVEELAEIRIEAAQEIVARLGAFLAPQLRAYRHALFVLVVSHFRLLLGLASDGTCAVESRRLGRFRWRRAPSRRRALPGP